MSSPSSSRWKVGEEDDLRQRDSGRSSRSGREWRSSHHHQGRDRPRDRRRRDEDEREEEEEGEVDLKRKRRRRRSKSGQYESTSPPPSRRRSSRSRSPRRTHDERTTSRRSERSPVPSTSHVARPEIHQENADEKDSSKQRPNFQPTGRLAADSNMLAGIALKYHEPPEARKPRPDAGWRLYVFKGSDLLDTVELGSRSCWLFGRERTIVDFPLDHPSCSKQHAVIQFRYLVKQNEFGDKDGKVRPYIIDLESANGTMVNGEAIPATRYVELKQKDMIQFGLSTREYVLMLSSSNG